MWLRETGRTAADLTPTVVEDFLALRRERSGSEAVARRGLGPLLRFLRGAGVAPARGEVWCSDQVAILLARYRAWLVGERGLADESVRCYCSQAKKFLEWLREPVDSSLARLDAATVTAFVLGHSTAAESVWSAKALVTALRSLLRFLHVEGVIPGPLTGAVPAVAGWRLAGLPRGLQRDQVAAVLAGPDTSTPAGLRDHAILTVLARLGLRGAEAAALVLTDVDWHVGEITVRGKGSTFERIPLPVEVGRALADYLTSGRPSCSCSALFVTARAPYHALSGTAVRAIMGRACHRAGLPWLGAHRLRHSLATEVLQAGAGLAEVGQLLRHRNQLSTTVYAKVDYTALRTLARPWPLPAPQGGRS
ncbi:tyrosine-type recombinase/integrase [Amycolatopsis acidicola]|uniref:Tyrosine-type recombinase/integrase n=2 Tax=Amycolatopsis acidicola TaxID=2596893 RepID=A0A5N0V466_9PSEU|nr:tyrosine-type recombinase/integrase [Amycolatopsis acidicola]